MKLQPVSLVFQKFIQLFSPQFVGQVNDQPDQTVKDNKNTGEDQNRRHLRLQPPVDQVDQKVRSI